MLLNHKVTVIVPSTVGTDAAPQELIDYQIENTLGALARVAGGSTAEAAEGAWIDDRGHLVRERVCNVYAYCSEAQLLWAVEAARRIARDIRRSMSQESVAVIVDNTMYFIDNDSEAEDSEAEDSAGLESLEYYYPKWLAGEGDRI